MDENQWLAKRFDENRGRLRRVAYRMLGSASEAEDAVQETWLKVSRADAGDVQNLGGWLTTIVARVSLDMLRSRASRREKPLATVAEAPSDSNPEGDVVLADEIGPALLIVLEMLAPAERVAFVLHDMFNLSFEEIAPIVKRTPAATRQLASRARRRVRGADTPATDLAQQRALVDAFLAASRDGDFERLVAVLSPEVVMRADDLAVRRAAANQGRGAPNLKREVRGAPLVADAFKGRAQGALRATIDGEVGAVWAVGARVLAAFLFMIQDDKITGIDLVMNPAHLAELAVQFD